MTNMLKCIEATMELERMKFEKTSLFRKMSVKFHLMMCNACTNYQKDSAAIDQLLKEKGISKHSYTPEELSELINELK